MNKKIIKTLAVVFMLTVLTGCNIPKNNNVKKPQEEKEVIISHEDIETMDRISDIIFDEKKESLKTEDLTEEERGEIARQLVPGNIYEVSGTEMIKEYEKYFGQNQKIRFMDVKCNADHGSEEENIMMKFDTEKDKYVYNDNHPGHGGGGIEFIGSEVRIENLEIKGNEYTYDAKILFYGKGVCQDVGGCEYGKAYKSYKDAENETNSLVDIDNTDKYWIRYELPQLKMDELFEDLRDKLDVYSFKFVKENGNLVFKSYEKAS